MDNEKKTSKFRIDWRDGLLASGGIVQKTHANYPRQLDFSRHVKSNKSN